jgi:putative FmdB family regulatory protein
MPLFDFSCAACGREFEALVRTGHPPRCPDCGSEELTRKPAAFALKTPERTQSFAAANRHKHAVAGAQDNALREAEAKKHRDEDH